MDPWKSSQTSKGKIMPRKSKEPIRPSPVLCIKPGDMYKATGIISTRRAYILEKTDRSFPRRIKIGPRATGWLEKEIFDWMNRKRMKRRSDLDLDE